MALTRQSPKAAVKRSLTEQIPTDQKTNKDGQQQQQKATFTAVQANIKLHATKQIDHTNGVESKESVRLLEKEDKEKEEEPKNMEANQQQQQQQPADQVNSGEISALKKFTIDCLLNLIKLIITLYDLISQPIFYFKHQVYKKQHEIDEVERSVQVDRRDPNSAWRQINLDSLQLELEARVNSFDTYDQMMANSFESYADKPCYGFRRVLHEQWSKRADSDKLFRQVKLSDFNWVTFRQFNKQIEAAKRGFLLQGIKAGDTVMLFADTRPEWQISTQALIRLGAVVGTMYSTLGVEGIVHSVNETQVSHVVAQKDRVSKLLKLKSKLPKLKKIIYFDSALQLPCAELGATESDKDDNKTDQQQGDHNNKWPKDFEHPEIECVSFGQLLAEGHETSGAQVSQLEEACRAVCEKRNKDSIAVIMYTSGSTGSPKGVLISHRNIMATIKSFSYTTKDFIRNPSDNVCVAYLPLAHIFEFCIESMMLFHGVRFGFATPHTLTDKSPGLQAGQKSDLGLLQPTVMIIVPLILDRIVQGVKQALHAQSYFKEQLVTYLINYKAYWQTKHYETPLVDRIVCSKVSTALGGRVKWAISGSAPLSGETQTFVRAALNIKLPQGFGTTETCAATACQLFDDQSTCNVGVPVANAQIKLEPWIEGNYRPSDQPHPRGEIVVGGEMIAHGYFNLDEQTKEAFYTDKDGVRWYRTGDIGEFLPNGNLKIIDRKKDLVKLQNGEYISLGKVESTLKSNPYLDNFCVYANSNHNYVVALGPANENSIKTLAQQLVDEHLRKSPSMSDKNNSAERKALLVSDQEQQVAIEELKEVLASYESDKLNNNNEQANISESDRKLDRKMSSLSTNSTSLASSINERLNKLCENKLIQKRVLDHVHGLARERNLMTMEMPKKLMLLAEEWTEDKNLVTAAMKIRRNYIYKRYETELARLYAPAVGVAN